MVQQQDLPSEQTPSGFLAESVRTAALHHGDRLAVAGPAGDITWAALDRAAGNLARTLMERKVAHGDIVALSMHSGPSWVVAATAVNRIGATIAGISPVVPPTERAAMISAVKPALVLADADLIDGIPLRTDVVEFSTTGLFGVDDPALPDGEADFHHDERSDSPTAPYAVCFTSGTSGTPKAALFSEEAARAVLRIDLGEHPVLGSGGHMVSSTQFAHVGFLLKLPGHALLGSTMHVMERWSASGAIGLVAEHRMGVLGVVAPQLALILRSDALEGADLSCLHTVIAGGAASPEALIDEARRVLGVSYSIRWSSTESGGVGLAATVDADHPEAIGTIGRPRPGVEARVADETGEVTPAGQIAELQVRSAALMDRYLGDPLATGDAFTPDGWLRTGDLALIRPDGNFVLAGRGNDMYIRGGYNVHPQEVEAVLGTHRAVSDVAVVPRPDDVMGHIGVAVVVPAEGAEPPSLEELRIHASGSLAPQTPRGGGDPQLVAAHSWWKARSSPVVRRCSDMSPGAPTYLLAAAGPAPIVIAAVTGILLAWLITIPLFRYKEFRPLSHRDVGDEEGIAIRAVLGHARYPRTTTDAGPLDVIPGWSWFAVSPRSGHRVPALVVVLQIGLPVAMVLTGIRFDTPSLVVAYYSFCVLAAAVAVVDARIWLIPWWMPWVGTAVGAILLSVAALDIGEPERIGWAAASGAGAFAVFFVLFLLAPGRLGFGDVRLALPIGMYAGFMSPLLVLWAFMLGSIAGVVVGLISILRQRGKHFAFGPPLALGALVAIWMSERLLS